MSLKQGQAAFLDAVLCRLYDWASVSPAYYAACPEDNLFYLELDWGRNNLAGEIKLFFEIMTVMWNKTNHYKLRLLFNTYHYITTHCRSQVLK